MIEGKNEREPVRISACEGGKKSAWFGSSWCRVAEPHLNLKFISTHGSESVWGTSGNYRHLKTVVSLQNLTLIDAVIKMAGSENQAATFLALPGHVNFDPIPLISNTYDGSNISVKAWNLLDFAQVWPIFPHKPNRHCILGTSENDI